VFLKKNKELLDTNKA